MSAVEDTLFTPLGDGRFTSAIPRVRGLGPALLMALGGRVESHRFGPTLDDADGEAFWDLTVGAEISSQLECDRELVGMLLTATEVSAAELEAVARVCNAARLALVDTGDQFGFQLLSAVCDEATDALLHDD